MHAVGSFLKAEVIDGAWAADALEICIQLVQHVGSRQRGSAMIDEEDEVREERRRILRRDALRHSCDLAHNSTKIQSRLQACTTCYESSWMPLYHQIGEARCRRPRTTSRYVHSYLYQSRDSSRGVPSI